MASLILSGIGGAFFGPLGRAAGALAGSFLDNAAASALTPARIEPSRLAQPRVQTSTEGAGIPLVYGRMRVAGQVIWASRFKETTTKRTIGNSKTGTRVIERRYSISFAIALAEGTIAGLGRVWANGEPFDLNLVAHRLYKGTPNQEPDPLIEAIQGYGAAPAYRDLAYLVLEDFPLDDFGDRIPSLAVEVVRPAPPIPGEPSLENLTRAVNLIPGCGEFALATTIFRKQLSPGHAVTENAHASAERSDFMVALDQLQDALPNLAHVTLVVCWFGSDLRAGICQIAPRVEASVKDTSPQTWSVAGMGRGATATPSLSYGRIAYGGTPSDASVLEAIAELKRRGLSIGITPFLLMDIPAGNTLPSADGSVSQPPYPWRGRISGNTPSADRTAAAATQIASFFGTAAAAHFTVSGTTITYSGPTEATWRRCVLHYAALAKAAGGVDQFLIGSEFIGLTRLRDATGAFPATAQLQSLAAQARILLGPTTKLSYAADWTEYGGFVPPEAGSDLLFPLDPLWADADINFVGIDWYGPLADTRDGDDFSYERTTFAANIEAGEGFDYYYASETARASGTKSLITDGAYGKPFVYRPKDLRGWWSQPHVERIAGVERTTATAWLPGSKPIRFCELGVPAIDRGANQPNVFVDPKSAESALPHFSSGEPDDLVQRRALETVLDWWSPAQGRNPLSSSGQRFIDTETLALWAWDARPFPQFPALTEVWGDGPNWRLGHWLNGRVGALSLAALIADTARRAGLAPVDVSGVEGILDGVLFDGPIRPRDALAPFLSAFGVSVREKAGRLSFFMEGRGTPILLDASQFSVDATGNGAVSYVRDEDAHTPSSARLVVLDAAKPGQVLSVTATGPTTSGPSLETALPAALSETTARTLARQRLNAANAARSTASLILPPSRLDLEAGDVVRLIADGPSYKIASLEGEGALRAKLVALPARARTSLASATPAPTPQPRAPSAPIVVFLDLPAPLTDPQSPQFLVAATATPWPNLMDVRTGPATAPARATLTAPATLGALTAALPSGDPNRWLGGTIMVQLYGGSLASAAPNDVLAGANRLAILPPDGIAEIVQFARAELIGPGQWALSDLLRGCSGTQARAAPAGSSIVLLDDRLVPLTLTDDEIGLPLAYAIGPPGYPATHAATTTQTATFTARARMPLSPIRLRATRSSLGTTLSWIRRGRSGAEAWAAQDPPLGERAELYRVEVRDGATLKRTWDVAMPTSLYAIADELTDFGTPQPSLSISIAQISPDYGTGSNLAGVV